MTTTADRPDLDPLDLSSLDFWGRPMAERDATFAELRRERPVSWHRPPEGMLMPGEDDPGFWAVVRHSDIGHVSKNAKLFCSGQGVQFQDAPPELLEATQSFLAMDAPRHTKLRKIVSAAFTPKQVARVEDRIAARARTIVDQLLEHLSDGSDGDFVQLVAKQLPMGTIYDLMGAPEEYQDSLAEAADLLVATNDPDVLEHLGLEDPLAAAGQALANLLGPATELIEARRRDPRDDLMTNLVSAEVDGESLTDQEIGAFFVLLSVAGNDTTRNTIAHSMLRLTEHPDQRAWLAEDLDGRMRTAVEEFVRHASPVLTFRRTALEDTELRGQRIAAGDKVVMFYESGNRDDEVFTDPQRFDLSRDPNPHVGFGGGGPHFCMGNMLARTQLRQIFAQLLTRAPGLTVGPPEMLRSNFVHAVKTMPCSLGG
ncbi:cytochrome P450 [Actinomycetospora rhizophila]|uniref:Cytochrome P450 n=1 Tax=Actinomycetospora rhizophila TaxID=1416876 RepID=A0ABV9ZNA4_9PSEU